MHHAAAAAILYVSNLDAATIQRMPTIMDFNFLPDMGRMNASLPSVARAGCSPIRSPARRRVQTCTPSSRLARRTASIRTAISSGCSRNCRAPPPLTTTQRSCHGICLLEKHPAGRYRALCDRLEGGNQSCTIGMFQPRNDARPRASSTP